jgi:8-oxo-dGTP diphosphatase
VAGVAMIDIDGRVLIAERPEGKSMAGMWEFPGGKIEDGESPEYALMREIEEELGVETRPCCFSPLTFVSHTYERFNLLMPLYACRVWKGIPQGKEGQNLKWVKPIDLYDEHLVPADIAMIPYIIENI